MSSEPADLKLVTCCDYLTETDGMTWRPVDWTAMKMVKALKGDPINGYFDVPVKGQVRRFDQNNISAFVELIPAAMARVIGKHIEGPATLVPIPNSHVTRVDEDNFRTLDLAQKIAQKSEGKLICSPALVFREPQVKSRNGGPRSPYHFERAYRLVCDISGPIVLVDDVSTTGGHMIGAAWALTSAKCRVALATAFGCSTKAQRDNPLEIREGILSLRKGMPFGFDLG